MPGGSPLGRGDFRPVYHPAGHDDGLRVVLEDLRTRRWMAMRTLLAHTGTDWALRTSRSQVLAAAAAGSDVVQAWRTEEPGSADAMMMRARVAVERALQARRQRHRRGEELAQHAREACWLAGEQHVVASRRQLAGCAGHGTEQVRVQGCPGDSAGQARPGVAVDAPRLVITSLISQNAEAAELARCRS